MKKIKFSIFLERKGVKTLSRGGSRNVERFIKNYYASSNGNSPLVFGNLASQKNFGNNFGNSFVLWVILQSYKSYSGMETFS